MAPERPHERLLRVLREHGARHVAHRALPVLDEELRGWLGRRAERRFDLSRGTDTAGRLGLPDEERRLPHAAAAYPYEGVSPRRFAGLLAALPLDPAQTTFVDYGCGKGRALILAAEAGFRRVVGVELSMRWAAVARANAAAHVARRPADPPLEVVCGDAAGHPPPPEPALVFLNNPFGEETLRRLVSALERSLHEHSRSLHVLYCTPAHRDVLDASPRFERVPLPPAIERPRRVRRLRDLRGYEFACDEPALLWRAR